MATTMDFVMLGMEKGLEKEAGMWDWLWKGTKAVAKNPVARTLAPAAGGIAIDQARKLGPDVTGLPDNTFTGLGVGISGANALGRGAKALGSSSWAGLGKGTSATSGRTSLVTGLPMSPTPAMKSPWNDVLKGQVARGGAKTLGGLHYGAGLAGIASPFVEGGMAMKDMQHQRREDSNLLDSVLSTSNPADPKQFPLLVQAIKAGKRPDLSLTPEGNIVSIHPQTRIRTTYTPQGQTVADPTVKPTPADVAPDKPADTPPPPPPAESSMWNDASKYVSDLPNWAKGIGIGAGALGIGALGHGAAGEEEDEEGNTHARAPWLGPVLGAGALAGGLGYMSGWDPHKLIDPQWWGQNKIGSHTRPILLCKAATPTPPVIPVTGYGGDTRGIPNTPIKPPVRNYPIRDNATEQFGMRAQGPQPVNSAYTPNVFSGGRAGGPAGNPIKPLSIPSSNPATLPVPSKPTPSNNMLGGGTGMGYAKPTMKFGSRPLILSKRAASPASLQVPNPMPTSMTQQLPITGTAQTPPPPTSPVPPPAPKPIPNVNTRGQGPQPVQQPIQPAEGLRGAGPTGNELNTTVQPTQTPPASAYPDTLYNPNNYPQAFRASYGLTGQEGEQPFSHATAANDMTQRLMQWKSQEAARNTWMQKNPNAPQLEGSASWLRPGEEDARKYFQNLSTQDQQHGYDVMRENAPTAADAYLEATGFKPPREEENEYTQRGMTDDYFRNNVLSEDKDKNNIRVLPNGTTDRIAERLAQTRPELQDKQTRDTLGMQNVQNEIVKNGGGESPGIMQYVQQLWHSLDSQPAMQFLLAAGLSLTAISALGMLTGNETLGGGMGALLGLGGLATAAFAGGAFDENSTLRKMISGDWQTQQRANSLPSIPQPIQSVNAGQLAEQGVTPDKFKALKTLVEKGIDPADQSTPIGQQQAYAKMTQMLAGLDEGAKATVNDWFRTDPEMSKFISGAFTGAGQYAQQNNQQMQIADTNYGPYSQAAQGMQQKPAVPPTQAPAAAPVAPATGQTPTAPATGQTPTAPVVAQGTSNQYGNIPDLINDPSIGRMISKTGKGGFELSAQGQDILLDPAKTQEVQSMYQKLDPQAKQYIQQKLNEKMQEASGVAKAGKYSMNRVAADFMYRKYGGISNVLKRMQQLQLEMQKWQ